MWSLIWWYDWWSFQSCCFFNFSLHWCYFSCDVGRSMEHFLTITVVKWLQFFLDFCFSLSPQTHELMIGGMAACVVNRQPFSSCPRADFILPMREEFILAGIQMFASWFSTNFGYISDVSTFNMEMFKSLGRQAVWYEGEAALQDELAISLSSCLLWTCVYRPRSLAAWWCGRPAGGRVH